MPVWKSYQDWSGDAHRVDGEVRVLENFRSPQLKNKRNLYVYLPPSYHHSNKSYPVIYMHDGQNLFDRALSYVGEWEVDEAMQRLAGEHIEAIIVGIANTGKERIQEYSPFDSQRFGVGRGNQYLEFITQTVKPLIDGEFRASTKREHTGLMGSSMGGLISLYGFFHSADVFGFAGVMSPSIWYAYGAILEYMWRAPNPQGHVYLDIGSQESTSWANRIGFDAPHRRYTATAQCTRDLLRDKGYRLDRELKFVEEMGATHHESAWARRFPDAARFLLKR
jgi:predicted alpha/beta superfamily hydrolase